MRFIALASVIVFSASGASSYLPWNWNWNKPKVVVKATLTPNEKLAAAYQDKSVLCRQFLALYNIESQQSGFILTETVEEQVLHCQTIVAKQTKDALVEAFEDGDVTAEQWLEQYDAAVQNEDSYLDTTDKDIVEMVEACQKALNPPAPSKYDSYIGGHVEELFDEAMASDRLEDLEAFVEAHEEMADEEADEDDRDAMATPDALWRYKYAKDLIEAKKNAMASSADASVEPVEETTTSGSADIVVPASMHAILEKMFDDAYAAMDKEQFNAFIAATDSAVQQEEFEHTPESEWRYNTAKTLVENME